jgi:predicted nuclease of restriction endonuclease-like (RecB) superfamily
MSVMLMDNLNANLFGIMLNKLVYSISLKPYFMTQAFSIEREYKEWIVDLKGGIRSVQMKAALTVNRQLLEMYWELGKEIHEKQKVVNWGEGLIDQVAKDLSAEFPGMKGFSRTNLFYIRRWYLFYESGGIVPQVVGLIPWGHNREIISKCSTIEEALFYCHKTVENSWSRAILTMQMESNLYERSGKIINNFDRALPAPQADLARETLKNPYNFDFLTLGKEAKERDVEQALAAHIQQLKATAFMPEYAGKLNFYLNVVNDKLRHEQDQPSVGIDAIPDEMRQMRRRHEFWDIFHLLIALKHIV